MAWNTLKLGAGGQLTGIDIQPDGTMVVRADTYGTYRWDPTAVSGANDGSTGKWIQLVTAASMPSPAVGNAYSNPWGGYEIRIAPSNTSRFYMYTGANVYVTTNKGATWATPTSPTIGADSNDNTKFAGPFLAIHPTNELICYSGTPGSGAMFTSNGGSSWTQIPTTTIAAGGAFPGAGQLGGNCVAFNPAGTTIYISSYGTGVYKNTTGGGLTGWALLNAAGSGTTGTMPTSCGKFFVGSDNKLYCAGDGTTNIYQYDPVGNAWSSNTTGTQNPNAIVMDPTNVNHLVSVSFDGYVSTTSTGAMGTWTGYNASGLLIPRTATDIPWLQEPYGSFMTGAALAYPASGTTLYMAAGVGVWTTPSPTSGPSVTTTWTSHSVGIEQLVVNKIVSVPGHNPIVACWDRALFTITNPSVYPTQYGPSYGPQSVSNGWSCDYASADHNYIVVRVNAPPSGTSSTAGGITGGGPSNFAAWGSEPSGNSGGAIAASSASNYLVLDELVNPKYTINSGTTWIDCNTGLTSPTSGWQDMNVSRGSRQNICADRVRPDTFYAYNSGTEQPGFYVSTDKGVNLLFQSGGGGHMGTSDVFHPRMKSVTGVSGNFYATPCAGVNAGTGNGFFEMQWNGTTLSKTTVTGVTDVWGFGFGAAKPGGSGYPAIYIYGTVSAAQDVLGVGGRGIWRSDDHWGTWNSLSGEFINGWIDQVKDVEGDANTYGIVYVGLNNTGAAIFTPDVIPTPSIGGRGTHMKMRLHLH